MLDVVIAGAVRTAIGKLGGGLAPVPATELGSIVIREALARAGVGAGEVDEVIMGQVIQAGCGLNPARQATLAAGLPNSVPAYTVNKVCASGMKAMTLGALSISAGEQSVVVAGGMENMSRAPYMLTKAREGYRLGDDTIHDAILSDALYDRTAGCHMGVTAENLATEFGITREDQDAFACASQERALAAVAAGSFSEEIVVVPVAQRKGDPVAFDTDEYPRPGTSPTVLSTLKPAFDPKGTVTAGNASGINDGAAAMVLLSAKEAQRRGIAPMARILAYASSALEPERMGMGPVDATRKALAAAKLSLGDIEAVELNEAFAAQSLAVIRDLGLDLAIVNMRGGAIALGHPVGASGARIVVTLLHVMAQLERSLGLATLCVGGGQGMCLILERI